MALSTSWPTGAKEVYTSRPTEVGRDSIIIRVTVELPKAAFVAGADGWVAVGTGKSLPVAGATLSSVFSGALGFSWDGFVEPTLEPPRVVPRYRIGFGLMELTFIGARKWVT